MVSRKPLPAAAQSHLGPASSNLPYPVTPTVETPPGFQIQDGRHQQQPTSDSGRTSPNVWGDEEYNDGAGYERIDHPTSSAAIPQSLRPGPQGPTLQASRENLSRKGSNNPFLQSQKTAQGRYDTGENTLNPWGEPAASVPAPSHAPPPPPVPSDSATGRTLNHQVSALSIADQKSLYMNHQVSSLTLVDQTSNPWQPAVAENPLSSQPPPQFERQDSGNQAWSTAQDKPSLADAPTITEPLIVVDSDGDESPAWDEDSEPDVFEMPATPLKEADPPENQHAWDGLQESQKTGEGAAHKDLNPEDAVRQADGWNIVEHEPIAQTTQQSGVIGADGHEIETREPEDEPPALPARPSEDVAPPQPPRPHVDLSSTSAPVPQLSQSVVKAQKKETYDIKKISWFDITSETNPRVSPILVQNANGPCPLLALVNALTLSTPSHVQTALIETLRSREQVSLGLLLDAVFDELMSGRRGDAAQELPDVSDLYSFLITLHTGMNVNPRFLPPAPTRKANDVRNSMSHVHPSEREDLLPGTFEETREMKLYSTFSVPLIHGWLPDKESPAYAALKRSANTYEDAQNLMFREEELVDKLQREGLSFEEQGTLEDIAAVKDFLDSSATQLTQHGLNALATSLPPAGVAILFRNDHFSTLYRNPESLQLMQLVTDMGYAGHQEVVWESLIDVNGENAEFFSGDFRLVGGADSAATRAEEGVEWAAGPSQPQGHQSQASTGSAYRDPVPPTPSSPNMAQEDADMALALQLQEEEEERHRAEIARRKREAQLSQQYIEQQGSQSNQIPVSHRGGGRGTQSRTNTVRSNAQEGRPAIPPRRQNAGGRPIDPEAGVDQPPPSYDVAATTPAYNPPPDHPAHPSADPTGRRSSSYSANSAANRPNQPARVPTNGRGRGTLIEQIPGRRPSGPVPPQHVYPDGRDRDCIVM
ncbi:hypothetical protein BP6252_00091 [Coleophoma cylindrospora]|uniref:MINDY deubiquitinase domain-containing protein n=1 Tax=Coleophoma cylindrospora TaxID=1849047 RepID=A0A3D8SP02_9HELO|nr:hypothetical protein BP6252_00091 [Coleophoma cylindrospora]